MNRLCILFLTLLSFTASSDVVFNTFNYQIDSFNYSKSRDGTNDDLSLLVPWSTPEMATGPLCEGQTEQDKIIQKGMIIGLNNKTGLVFTDPEDNVQYDIFETGIQGIGWILSAKDKNATKYTPLRDIETQLYPFDDKTSLLKTMGTRLNFALVKLPNQTINAEGPISFSLGTIAKVNCYDINNNLLGSGQITVNQVSGTVKALACNVNQSDSNIPMGNFIKNVDFSVRNDNFGGVTKEISLTCDKGITPYMTISDGSNPNNDTQIIGLNPSEGQATGIGVQIFYQDQVVTLGIDSSSKGNKNQIKLGEQTQNDNQIIEIPLTFKYIQTAENVTAGTANATATVTFSYQ